MNVLVELSLLYSLVWYHNVIYTVYKMHILSSSFTSKAGSLPLNHLMFLLKSNQVVENAADRVFMAARLFVRFFNQRGGSLQQRVLELLALADSADNFHKKTVKASFGGGVASVAGSITTITGLILAPFTAGTSLIVTAVGIGVATAGGVEGMDMLEEWNFEQYAESISKKHLNQNVKHVMKEGGRAGKALVINTESLISTIQVLNVAGGAAKAVQVMSITTGVMSGLFLALDVFFLAKDSMELKKGAKTEFETHNAVLMQTNKQSWIFVAPLSLRPALSKQHYTNLKSHISVGLKVFT
uniref:Uncharacterized protein n=1 Tax=Mola mola TaxID=94237 RepID=A0A3Q3XRM9_MOLML